VDPVPDPLLLRNVLALGIETGPLNLKLGTLTTRPQGRSLVLNIIALYCFVCGYQCFREISCRHLCRIRSHNLEADVLKVYITYSFREGK
jgi:hypothetical protein